MQEVSRQQEENKDSLVNVAFGTVAQEDLTHAISTVNTSELTKKVNSSSSLVGLESLIGGYTGNVWGQGALVLVDGVPRSASNVRASEIESVSVMKDAAAVVLYGSRAAKGVILITTKRGKMNRCASTYGAMQALMFPNLIQNIWIQTAT